jgi:hypothetical protein
MDKAIIDKDSDVRTILSNDFIDLKFEKNNAYIINKAIKIEIINFHL